MDWRLDADYAFCEQLDLAGWAWQFMRRSAAYRADYTEFMQIWQQLEAAYGTPPERDFFKWKQDPRAWRSEAEIYGYGCGSEICPGENDQVLIECWMGAKWGFRKFPIDPVTDFPDDLAWRDFPIDIEVIDPSARDLPAQPEFLTLRFNLSLPLPAQLEAAKRQLIAARQACAAAGSLPPYNTRTGAPRWRLWLRLLDALESGETLRSTAPLLALDKPEQDAAAACSMRDGGYRQLLQLSHPQFTKP